MEANLYSEVYFSQMLCRVRLLPLVNSVRISEHQLINSYILYLCVTK